MFQILYNWILKNFNCFASVFTIYNSSATDDHVGAMLSTRAYICGSNTSVHLNVQERKSLAQKFHLLKHQWHEGLSTLNPKSIKLLVQS